MTQKDTCSTNISELHCTVLVFISQLKCYVRLSILTAWLTRFQPGFEKCVSTNFDRAEDPMNVGGSRDLPPRKFLLSVLGVFSAFFSAYVHVST